MLFKDGVGRKFIVCSILLILHYIALMMGTVTPDIYTSLLWVVLGALIGGNLGERVISHKENKTSE